MVTSRIWFTAAQKAELWERWKNGQSAAAISRALERKNKTGVERIVVLHGGIGPAPRRRALAALRFEEREEISRGIAVGRSIRQIAQGLGRAPSTVSREIRRNGGSQAYRANRADRRARERALRPKPCRLAVELKKWLDEAKTAGTRKVFIAFHAPTFCRSGMGPIPESQNPHNVIAPYAKDLEIVVFNGHVHTTELYEVQGVKYLLLGGGGAEQDPILPGRTAIKVPENYPPDLYWKGQPPKEEYNYLLVDAAPDRKTQFTLNRFRPWAAKPFERVELFGSAN